jgi:hypothetical protein
MMFRGFLFIALLALAATTFSDGPGSRIRLGPQPQPAAPVAGPADRDLQRCEEMNGSAKERCLRELQIATREAQRAAPHNGPNPESAGTGASTPDAIGPGTAGPGSVGGSAAR